MNKTKYLIACIILFITSVNVCAQQGLEKVNAKPVNQIINVGLGGPGLGLSLNYERQISNNIWAHIGTSVGIALPYDDVTISIPAGISYIVGKQKNFLDLGGGLTPISFTDTEAVSAFNDAREWSLLIFSTIAYRYQPMESSLFFRASLNPAFGFYKKNFIPAAGLSIGYSF
jgi:hypothetical protein